MPPLTFLLLSQSSFIRKLDYTPGKFLNKFLKRLVDFYKPSNNRFSHQDLMPGYSMPSYVSAGLDLIDVLLDSSEVNILLHYNKRSSSNRK